MDAPAYSTKAAPKRCPNEKERAALVFVRAKATQQPTVINAHRGATAADMMPGQYATAMRKESKPVMCD